MRLTEKQILEINLYSNIGQGFRPNPHDIHIYRAATWNEKLKDTTLHSIYVEEPVIYMARTTGGYHSFGDRGYYYGSELEGYVDEGWDSFVVLSDVLKILKPNLSYLYYEQVTKLIKTTRIVENNQVLDYDENGAFMNGDNSWWHTEIKYVIPSELYGLLERLQMFEERSVILDRQNFKIIPSKKPLPIEPSAAGYYGKGSKENKQEISDRDLMLLLDDLNIGYCSMLDETLENYIFDSIQGSLLKQRDIYPYNSKEYFIPQNAIIDASEPSFDYKGVRSKETFVCLTKKDEQYSVQIGDNTTIFDCKNYPLTKEGLQSAINLVKHKFKQYNMEFYNIYNADIEFEKYNN